MTRPRFHVALTSLAAALVAAPLVASLTLAADPIVVQPGDTLTSISRRHGVPIETIVRLNGLRNPNRIVAGQRLRLEAASPAPPAAAPTTPPAAAAARTHVVRAGEHLTGIARHYGTSIAAIVAANRIGDASRIYAGQRLTIPGTASAPAATAAPAAPRTHVVRAGEHLTGIARHYGTSIAAIVAANRIGDASRIYAGQRLTIPGTASAPAATAAPAAPRTHVVRAGEHLTGIARHYGTSIAAIVAANRIGDASRIYAGQRLTIPGTASAPAPAAGKASARMPASMAELVRSRDAVRRVIVEEAGRHGVSAAFALAVAWQESGWQQDVVSYAGAIGVMQLLPTTAEWVGEAMLGTAVDPRDLRQNVRAGVRLLAHYLDRYDGDRALALAAYYQGQTSVDRHGIYPVSRPYIASITVLEALFGG